MPLSYDRTSEKFARFTRSQSPSRMRKILGTLDSHAKMLAYRSANPTAQWPTEYRFYRNARLTLGENAWSNDYIVNNIFNAGESIWRSIEEGTPMPVRKSGNGKKSTHYRRCPVSRLVLIWKKIDELKRLRMPTEAINVHLNLLGKQDRDYYNPGRGSETYNEWHGNATNKLWERARARVTKYLVDRGDKLPQDFVQTELALNAAVAVTPTVEAKVVAAPPAPVPDKPVKSAGSLFRSSSAESTFLTDGHLLLTVKCSMLNGKSIMDDDVAEAVAKAMKQQVDYVIAQSRVSVPK